MLYPLLPVSNAILPVALQCIAALSLFLVLAFPFPIELHPLLSVSHVLVCFLLALHHVQLPIIYHVLIAFLTI